VHNPIIRLSSIADSVAADADHDLSSASNTAGPVRARRSLQNLLPADAFPNRSPAPYGAFHRKMAASARPAEFSNGNPRPRRQLPSIPCVISITRSQAERQGRAKWPAKPWFGFILAPPPQSLLPQEFFFFFF